MSGNMSVAFLDRCVEELVPIFREELGTNTEFTLDHNQMTDLAMTAYARAIIAFKLDKAPKIHFSDFVYPAKAVILKEMEAAKIKAEEAAKTSELDEKYVLVDGPLAAAVTGKSAKTAFTAAGSVSQPAKVRKMRKAPVSVSHTDEFRVSDELYDALVEIMLELRKDLGRFKKDDLPAMDMCSVRINMFMSSLLGKIESDAKVPWHFYAHYALPQALEEFNAMVLNQESFVAKKSDFEFSFVDDAFTDLFCERMVNIMFISHIQGTPAAIAEAERTIYDAINRMTAVKVKETYDVDIYTEQVVQTVKSSAEKLKQRIADCAEFLLQTAVNNKNGNNAVSHAIAEAPKSAAELTQKLIGDYPPATLEESDGFAAFYVTRDSVEASKPVAEAPNVEPKISETPKKSEPKPAVYQPASTSYGQISANPTPIPYKPAVQASNPAVQAAKPNGRPRKSNKPVDVTNKPVNVTAIKEADEQKFKHAPWIVTNIQNKNTVDFIPELYKYDPVTFNQVSSVMEFFNAQDKTHVMNLFDSEVLRNIINGIVLQNKKQGLHKVSVLRIDVQPGTVFVVNVPNGPGKVKEVTLLLGDLHYIWTMQIARYVNINRISESTELNNRFTNQLREMFVVHDGTDARYIELSMYSP